jgi:hypothetical protein
MKNAILNKQKKQLKGAKPQKKKEDDLVKVLKL